MTDLNSSNCGDPHCVRCSKSGDVFQKACVIFKELPDSIRIQVPRIHAALENPAGDLMFELDGLHSVPFYQKNELPEQYLSEINFLETNWHQIRTEYDLILQKEAAADFQNVDAGNGDIIWKKFFLVNQGARLEENLSKCPKTSEIVDRLQSIIDANLLGHVFFSHMRPGCRLETHRGLSNVRMRCHLALQVPPEKLTQCAITVGGVEALWREGECLLFDDALPHSVAYDFDSGTRDHFCDRVVLIIDFWHPDVTTQERRVIQKLFPSLS